MAPLAKLKVRPEILGLRRGTEVKCDCIVRGSPCPNVATKAVVMEKNAMRWFVACDDCASSFERGKFESRGVNTRPPIVDRNRLLTPAELFERAFS
jgi:hypothetical protein